MTESKEDGFAEWYEEDAKRLNDLADTAKKQGVVVKTGDDEAPELNKDGSLKNEKN